MELILYTGAGNASERVLWALNYKGLPYRQIDAGTLAAAEYARISPLGYVPALYVNGSPLTETMAIAEFCEEIAPEPSLLPGPAWERARIREICEIVNSSLHPPQNRSVLAFLRPDLTGAELKTVRADWLGRGLERLAPRLWRRSAFAVGEDFSLADIFVAAIYRRAVEQGIARAAFAAYEAWMRHLFAQPMIQAAAPFDWRGSD